MGGNHRYQVGFSGDVKTLSWENLAYQPYFSSTASNVGYGFWSHDIVGPGSDHELYLRWLQWGCVSGIMRNHDRGMSSGKCMDPFPQNPESNCDVVQPWRSPSNFFQPMRDALQLRQSLVPYIYSATREAFETGVSLIRPMYYYNQKVDKAYNVPEQYYFGSKMMIRPVVEKGDASTMAKISIWLPQGSWYEITGGYSHRYIDVEDVNGTEITKFYDLSEIPMFVHEMAAIPFLGHRDHYNQQHIGRAGRDYEHLDIKLFLCDMTRAFGKIYQDDGDSTAYLDGHYSNVIIEAAPLEKSNETLNVTSYFETYNKDHQPDLHQSFTVIIPNVGPPLSIKTGSGHVVQYFHHARPGDYSWRYDAFRMSLSIDVPPQNLKDGQIIFQLFIAFDKVINDQRTMLNNVSNIMRRAKLSKLNLDATGKTPGTRTPEDSYLAQLASTPTRLLMALEHAPKTFFDVAAGVNTLLEKSIAEVQSLQHQTDTNRWQYSMQLLEIFH